MVTFNPCDRLNVIYFQLVPSILNSARNEIATNIRSIIESHLPKLEDASYSLANKCQNCHNCELCNEEHIRELFANTRFELETIWQKNHDLMSQIEEHEQTVLA